MGDSSPRFAFKKRHAFLGMAGIIAALSAYYYVSTTPFGTYNMLPDQGPSLPPGTFSYDVPLDPTSPWPKFRANELQNGRANVVPTQSNLRPWEFKTDKGVFSSPVVDENDTVYVGSADHYFYAINSDGSLKWKFSTGEVIDSAALLDDKERVYFASGDGYTYALNRRNGELIWKFRSHSNQEMSEEFGITTHINHWFEGNVAILKDGTLIVPNDNHLVYALDRDTGESRHEYLANEMIWSLPALNPDTGTIYFGTTFAALRNIFAFDAATGERLWATGGLGSVAASILLTSKDPKGGLVVGGFDGFLRAFTQEDGKQLWKLGARDHIYGSPAQQRDGTIIQPSADGTVYAINPEDGSVIWVFDTLEPIRSSPAIDANGIVYIGSGEGKLYAINSDGTLRWAYQCILDQRNDMNSSPAIGHRGVYIAGESGGVFFIPFDYPLSDEGKRDPRATLGRPLARESGALVYTTRFGELMLDPPADIDANEPLTFSLLVRKNGETLLSAIDGDSLKVSFPGHQEALVNVSADRRFLTVLPRGKWTEPEGGELRIDIRGDYVVGLSRLGLKFFGGEKGGEFEQTFAFQVRPRTGQATPYHFPEQHGDPASAFEISRLAIPHPTMLPSWNQIGFDSQHHLVGAVERRGSQGVMWVVPGKLDEETQTTVVDPSLNDVFPVYMDYDNGLVTLYNYEGYWYSFLGTWNMPMELYRVATKANPATGRMIRTAALNTVGDTDEIVLYGRFLKLMGLSDFRTGLMRTAGGADFKLWGKGYVEAPEGVGDAIIEVGRESATVTVSNGELKKDEHVFAILLIDAESGKVVPANYLSSVRVEADEAGNVNRVTLDYENGLVVGKVRAYYMVDTYPAYRQEAELAP